MTGRRTHIELNSEDAFLAVAVFVVPVVVEFLLQLILARVDYLLSILCREVEVFITLCIGKVVINLCPCEVNLSQCGIGCTACSATYVCSSVFAYLRQQLGGILEVADYLLVNHCLWLTHSIVALTYASDYRHRSPYLYEVVVIVSTKEFSLANAS